MGLSLPRASSALVGGHRFHVKQHALLPVGRKRETMVRGARIRGATDRRHGSALGALDYMVFYATAINLTAPKAERDATNLRTNRTHW